jgi:hypothetical protein
MATRKRIGLSEKQLVQSWQGIVGQEMASEEGGWLRVIHPGRASGSVGPDFRDAVVAMNESELVKGDVEIHTKASDWYSHGHHRNPEYNHVILHVVLWHDCNSPSLRQDGSPVPIVRLSEAHLMATGQLPCFRITNQQDYQTLGKLLDAAGENRFEQKAALFRASLGREEAGQVLYHGMMRALGYSRNMKPFEELANRLPIKSLEDMKTRDSLSLKQALLLGTAGFLPSQWLCREFSAQSEIEELENIWRSVGREEPMRARDWHLSHVYPNNSPVRRILAESHLLQRYHKSGTLTGILQLVQETPSIEGHCRLENGLVIASDDERPALLGHGKAAEIIINVILPFVFSWARDFLEAGLAEKALKLYLNYPRLAENEITRHMATQLRLQHSSHLTACRHQGLIHIFRNYCCQGNCSQCPLLSQG